MKIVFALSALVLGKTASDHIQYLCNECVLYDMDSNTIFDELEIPQGLRPPPPPQEGYNDTLNINFSFDEEVLAKPLTMKTLICFSIFTTVVGTLNLAAIICMLLNRRTLNGSAKKTYMNTAIIDTQ